MKHLFLFSVILLSIFSGCKPEPVFPVEPVLTFKEYIQNTGSDSLQVVFSFTDGDGDIGISEGATDSNMVLTLYVRDNAGNFIPQDNLSTPAIDSIYYNYRIPQLTRSQKGVEGDVYLTVNKGFIARDTIRFNAFMVDQTQHRSATVQTPSVILTR
ncbi:MAG: hypothetical protein MUC87_19165 [Bacteroidia bacterium]|jgi:hypothetical protein|nr:hypothetical protein [Bacteroidia bacterium]